MKTLSSNQKEKLNRSYLQPIYLVHLFLAGETLYFSDRCLKYNSHYYEDYLMNLPDTAHQIEQFGGYGNLNAELTFRNERFRGYNTLLEFFDDYPITRRGIEMYVLYVDEGETFGSDVSTKILKGAMGEIRDIGKKSFSADLMTVLHKLDNQNPFTQINLTNWPDAAPSSVGEYENQVYGSINDLPCQCVKTGAITTLFSDITAAANVIFLSDVTYPKAFPGTGTVLIDGEQITYTGLDTANKKLTGCSRGRNGTSAAAHQKGTPVCQVMPNYKWLVAGHICKSVSNVKIDKIRADSGDYTINLNENGKTIITFTNKILTKLQGSHSHGLNVAPLIKRPTGSSWSVAAPWYFAGAIANIRDASTATYVRCSMSYITGGLVQQFVNVVATFPAWAGGAISKVWLCIMHKSAKSGAYSYVRVDLPTIITLDTSSVIVTQKFVLATGYPSSVTIKINYGGAPGEYVDSAIYEVWLEVECSGTGTQAAVGSWNLPQEVFSPFVTCTVEGYKDDDLGSYTGTPNLLIENPSDVRRHLFVATMGIPSADIGSSFTATRTVYANRVSGGYKFAISLHRISNLPSEILREFDIETRSQLREEGGKFELSWNNLGELGDPVSSFTVDKDNLIGEPIFNQTSQENIKNTIRIKYWLDWGGTNEGRKFGEFLKQTERPNPVSITKYGILYDDYEFVAVKSQAMAEEVGDWILNQKRDVIKTLKVCVDWSARILEKDDWFVLVYDFWSGIYWRVLSIQEISNKQQFDISAIAYSGGFGMGG